MEKISWKDCIQKKIIFKIRPNQNKAIEMLRVADLRFEFWNNKIDEKFMALKVEAYYDIIRDLIFAHLYEDGFNCTNHKCLIAYLKYIMPDFGYEVNKIDELRRIRNQISYRGVFIDKSYLIKNELEFQHIIKTLKNSLKSV